MEENMNNNAPAQGGKGLSIASMVCGIVSLVFFCTGWFCIGCGLVGIVLGAVSLAKKSPGKGMAIAGLVCSIIGIALYVIVIVALAATMPWAFNM